MKIQRAAYPLHWLEGISKEHRFIVNTLYPFNHKKNLLSLFFVGLFTYYLLRPLTSLLTDWLHSFGSLSLKASLTFKASLHIKCLPALHGACGVRLPSLLLHPLSHPLSHSLTHSFISPCLSISYLTWIKCIICQGQVRLSLPSLLITK